MKLWNVIWVDAVYQVVVDKAWIRSLREPKVVSGTRGTGFQAMPRSWIVERTFGWLNRDRRLSEDYKRTTETNEALVDIAMIHVMVRRLRT